MLNRVPWGGLGALSPESVKKLMNKPGAWKDDLTDALWDKDGASLQGLGAGMLSSGHLCGVRPPHGLLPSPCLPSPEVNGHSVSSTPFISV